MDCEYSEASKDKPLAPPIATKGNNKASNPVGNGFEAYGAVRGGTACGFLFRTSKILLDNC